MKQSKATPNQTISKKVRVVSLFVNVCNYQSVVSRIVEMAGAENGGYVCVANVHMAMEARDDPRYAEIVNAAEMVVPDGMPLAWMQKLQGRKEASQVRGPSLMPMLMKSAEAIGLNIGFYGGQPEVIEKIRKRAQADFPKLDITYAYSPPFRPLSEEEAADIVERINAAETQILFVGLGCPKAERWMANHTDKLNCVMIGVGAAFDFYAGSIAESPLWMQRSGLEWLFRLAREPTRLWKRYLLLNPRFLWLAFRQLLVRKQ